MAHPALRMDERYTWDDYQSWPDDESYELIGGEAFAMAPSPVSEHQDISSELHCRMHPFFKGRKCKLFAAPMDVKLSDEDVVQPDLLVVCDQSQIRRHIEGPPALVVEIVSPGSARLDRVVKPELYARFGIQEYWIVTPFPCMVEIFWLQGERYVFWKGFTETDVLTSPGFPDLQVELAGVFEFAIQQHAHEVRVVKEGPARYKTG
jgi:Uma2 family endonuclease